MKRLALVTNYRARILTRLHRIVDNEHDARDLAQEGFLKAWRSIRQFEGRSSFYAWLYSITVNQAVELLRRKRRCLEVELNDAIASSVPTPRANYQHNEIRQHIDAALAQLSPEHRVVIVLKVLQDLQYQEIAKTLNVSVGTVMSRLYYGRKKLRSLLKPLYQLYESPRSQPVRFHHRKRCADPALGMKVETASDRHCRRPRDEGTEQWDQNSLPPAKAGVPFLITELFSDRDCSKQMIGNEMAMATTTKLHRQRSLFRHNQSWLTIHGR